MYLRYCLIVLHVPEHNITNYRHGTKEHNFVLEGKVEANKNADKSRNHRQSLSNSGEPRPPS